VRILGISTRSSAAQPRKFADDGFRACGWQRHLGGGIASCQEIRWRGGRRGNKTEYKWEQFALVSCLTWRSFKLHSERTRWKPDDNPMITRSRSGYHRVCIGVSSGLPGKTRERADLVHSGGLRATAEARATVCRKTEPRPKGFGVGLGLRLRNAGTRHRPWQNVAPAQRIVGANYSQSMLPHKTHGIHRLAAARFC
jgi:hypothetical protein